MEEFLKTDRNKINYLKDIKKSYDIHEIDREAAIKLIKLKFDSISAAEIAQVEQELNLIKSDKSEIQEIVDIFTPFISNEFLELDASHPIQHYLDELKEVQILIEKLELLNKNEFILNPYLEIYEILNTFKIHLTRKQMQLYPNLEAKGFDRPAKIMWTLDDFIWEEIKKVSYLLKGNKVAEFIKEQKTLILDIKDLLAKEIDILYPAALKLLSKEDFIKMASNDYEIGYFVIKVKAKTSNNEQPSTTNNFAIELNQLLNKYKYTNNNEELDVATGKMTLDQINLVFKNMPVDITYVDENEIVKFYTDTKNRVFPRSKGVIGRAVKNCHPAKSVHIVEEIIEKFRNNEQDEAEFWINKPDTFIYIKYVAVRDDNNNFKGILEMMQDCTHIRALKNSRTLLTWEDDRLDDEKLDQIETNQEITIIDEQTNLKDLFAEYPNLKEFLIELNSNFKILNSPLGRVMLPKATLKVASERANMDVKVLINEINRFIEHN